MFAVNQETRNTAEFSNPASVILRKLN